MTYQLYGVRRSGSAAVEVLLTRLGVDLKLHDATPWSCPPGPAFVGLTHGVGRPPEVASIWAHQWGD